MYNGRGEIMNKVKRVEWWGKTWWGNRWQERWIDGVTKKANQRAGKLGVVEGRAKHNSSARPRPISDCCGWVAHLARGIKPSKTNVSKRWKE